MSSLWRVCWEFHSFANCRGDNSLLVVLKSWNFLMTFAALLLTLVLLSFYGLDSCKGFVGLAYDLCLVSSSSIEICIIYWTISNFASSGYALESFDQYVFQLLYLWPTIWLSWTSLMFMLLCISRYCIEFSFAKEFYCLCSWQGLGNMATTEAMRLFVKILEVCFHFYSQSQIYMVHITISVLCFPPLPPIE